MIERTLGEVLRDARGSRPALNIVRAGGPVNLYAYENGTRLPRVETLKWLCDYYEISFDYALDLLQAARRQRDMSKVA